MNTATTPAHVELVAELTNAVHRRVLRPLAKNSLVRIVAAHNAILDALAQPALAAPPTRCNLCGYQHGHCIGCENNPVDIALKAQQPTPAASPEPTREMLTAMRHELTSPSLVSDRELTCMYRAARATLASGTAQVMQPVEASPAEVFDMLKHLARQRKWSERTFGPGMRTAGVVDHIRKELLEIEADPHDLTEWIDVVILALDGAWRAGGTPESIIETIAAKQAKNEGRVWPDWRTMPTDRAIEHDRTGEVAAPVAPTSPHPEFDRGFSEGWDRATARAALSAAQPQVLSDAQIEITLDKLHDIAAKDMPYEGGLPTGPSAAMNEMIVVVRDLLKLQAGGEEA